MARPEELRSPQERKNKDLPVPSVPTLDTAEMLDEMGPEWKLPRRRDAEELIHPWIEVCNKAIEGSELIRRFKETGELKLNFEALGYYSYLRDALRVNFEQSKETIQGALRAFNALLGKNVDEMEAGDPDKARTLVNACERRVDLFLRRQLLKTFDHHF